MDADVIILGGGLSGLAAADALSRSGRRVTVLEARDRPGGRVLSMPHDRGHYDLGPAWVWPHQFRIRALVQRFGLDLFGQETRGRLVFEDAGGTIRRDLDMATMGGALRLAGGAAALTDALAGALPADTLRLRHRATEMRITEHGVTVTGTAPGGGFAFSADKTLVALPPRLAAGLKLDPSLPEPVLRHMQGVPTWMAGHAKLVAVYDTAFWREAGLNGDAISHRGPLGEIHDASPQTGAPALFGFAVPGAAAMLGTQGLEDAARAQLARLFGEAAGTPRAMLWKDWSTDPMTATAADMQPPAGHPAYGALPDPGPAWADRLIPSGTETAAREGGFLEGALESAERDVAALLAQDRRRAIA